ncbi:MAG: hypothetical protein H6732_03480 [Alphaproteobacteria bacterium]|nr:hypothetical protein [Alphaproteobacteria bacterium]
MRSRLATAAIAGGLVACVPPGMAERSSRVPDLAPPTIRAARLSCDAEGAAWTVDVATSSWAGSAVLLWTTDGSWVERHTRFRSVGAEPEGGGDQLTLGVAVVLDFRQASDGQTALSCLDEPSAWIWVTDLEGTPTDCVARGPAPALLEGQPETPPCPLVSPEGEAG